MPLNALDLTTKIGSIGRRFSASLTGLTDGSHVRVLPHPAGFYAQNGRIHHSAVPEGSTSFTVRERTPLDGFRDTTLTITATSEDVLDTLTAAVPTLITAAGSATLRRARAGSTLTLATNPGGAWSLAGGVLSWSTAAIGVEARPIIVETLGAVQRETRLATGAGNTTPAPAPTSRAWSYADAGSNIASLHDFATLAGADGSQINTVADGTPYARTLTAVTGKATSKPKVLANALNGKPAAVTAYADQSYFTFPTDLLADWGRQGMAFAILKLAADPPAPADAGGAPFGNFGSGNGLVSLYPNEFNASEMFDSDFGSADTAGFQFSLSPYNLAAWHSMVQHTRHGDKRVRINAADVFRNGYYDAATPPSWGTSPKLGASPFSYSNHSYAIAITFRRVVPLDLLQKVEGKAHHDRGLQGLLPADHPYKASPPTVSSTDPLAILIAGQKVAIEGDSITARADSWGNRLGFNYPTVKLQNFAVDGAVMEGATNSLESRTAAVLAYGGKAIVLLIGTNDINNTALYPTVADWMNGLRRRIAAYRAGGYTKVIVGTMTPQTDSAKQTRIVAANALVRAAAEVDAVIDFANIPAFTAAGAAADTQLFSDGLHPTSLGQAYMLDAAEPLFLKALGMVTAGSVTVATGAKLAFPVRVHGNRSTFALSGADAASFELVNGAEGAVAWDMKTLRYAGDASAVAGTKNVTVTATDEFGRAVTVALAVVAA